MAEHEKQQHPTSTMLSSLLMLTTLVVLATTNRVVVDAFVVVPNSFSSNRYTSAVSRPSGSLVVVKKDRNDFGDGDHNPLYDENTAAQRNENMDEEVDIAIVGAGIGGLAAGAILNTLYNKKVGVYESHYLPGGCAHAFERLAKTKTDSKDPIRFTFDSGPTIVLGCSQKPFNGLRQVLDAIGQSVEWIRYDGWGMIERPCNATTADVVRWKCELGTNKFQKGPLLEFGGPQALEEFEALRATTKELLAGIGIPAMAMRPGNTALVPLLKYFPTLVQLISAGPDKLTGTFGAYMDGPSFTVTNKWLRDWLDALAFSLSGLPASRTSAAAMAFIVNDMHRDGAALDYPRGGFGVVIDALCKGITTGGRSKVHLRTHVEKIDFNEDGSRATGITLRSGRSVRAREGVICNAPVWSLKNLVHQKAALERLSGIVPNEKQRPIASVSPMSWIPDENETGRYSLRTKRPPQTESSKTNDLLNDCNTAEMTGSFLHLHVAIDAKGLDLSRMEAHYTVMDRGLSGDPNLVVNGVHDGPCGELNMIAVSNPCIIDPSLAPEGYMVLHAYGAGNEPYEVWERYKDKRRSPEYQELKEERSQVLWRALESVIPDIRDRIVLDLVGSPLTHERFLRRPSGTYGSATEDYLKDGSTPIPNLVLAGDQIFPGIGLPAVAISGASAANAMVNPLQQWRTLDALKDSGRI